MSFKSEICIRLIMLIAQGFEFTCIIFSYISINACCYFDYCSVDILEKYFTLLFISS